MSLLCYQTSFPKIRISFFFLVMESSDIVLFCNKLCGAATEGKVSQGYILKNHPGPGEHHKNFLHFSVSSKHGEKV